MVNNQTDKVISDSISSSFYDNYYCKVCKFSLSNGYCLKCGYNLEAEFAPLKQLLNENKNLEAIDWINSHNYNFHAGNTQQLNLENKVESKKDDITITLGSIFAVTILIPFIVKLDTTKGFFTYISDFYLHFFSYAFILLVAGAIWGIIVPYFIPTCIDTEKNSIYINKARYYVAILLSLVLCPLLIWGIQAM